MHRRLMLVVVAVMIITVVVGGCGARKQAMEEGKINSLGQTVPAPIQAVPTGPTQGAVTLIFVKYDGKHAFPFPGYMTEPLHLSFPGISKKFNPDGFEEMSYINPGFGIRQGDCLFMAHPGGYNMTFGKEYMDFNPDAFTEVVKKDGETDAEAIMRTRDEEDQNVTQKMTKDKKSQVGDLTPPPANDGPELTLYGPITKLTPIAGKKGRYQLIADVEADEPELVKTVVPGQTRINGLVVR